MITMVDCVNSNSARNSGCNYKLSGAPSLRGEEKLNDYVKILQG